MGYRLGNATLETLPNCNTNIYNMCTTNCTYCTPPNRHNNQLPFRNKPSSQELCQQRRTSVMKCHPASNLGNSMRVLFSVFPAFTAVLGGPLLPKALTFGTTLAEPCLCQIWCADNGDICVTFKPTQKMKETGPLMTLEQKYVHCDAYQAYRLNACLCIFLWHCKGSTCFTHRFQQLSLRTLPLNSWKLLTVRPSWRSNVATWGHPVKHVANRHGSATFLQWLVVKSIHDTTQSGHYRWSQLHFRVKCINMNSKASSQN